METQTPLMSTQAPLEHVSPPFRVLNGNLTGQVAGRVGSVNALLVQVPKVFRDNQVKSMRQAPRTATIAMASRCVERRPTRWSQKAMPASIGRGTGANHGPRWRTMMSTFPGSRPRLLKGAFVNLSLANSLASAIIFQYNPDPLRRRLTAQIAGSDLKQRPNLSPESRVTLAKAQLVLGQSDEGAANLNHALKVKPKLKVDPNLKVLVTPNPILILVS